MMAWILLSTPSKRSTMVLSGLVSFTAIVMFFTLQGLHRVSALLQFFLRR